MVVLRLKLDDELGGIGISYEESICTWRKKGRVYDRSTGTRICVGEWVQFLFSLLGVDDLKFTPPITGSVKGVLYKMFLCLCQSKMGAVPIRLLIRL